MMRYTALRVSSDGAYIPSVCIFPENDICKVLQGLTYNAEVRDPVTITEYDVRRRRVRVRSIRSNVLRNDVGNAKANQ